MVFSMRIDLVKYIISARSKSSIVARKGVRVLIMMP
jgi:hypothetical protein